MKKNVLVINLFMTMGLVACSEITTATTDAFDDSMNVQNYTRDTTSRTREEFFKGSGFSDAVEDNGLNNTYRLKRPSMYVV